MNITLYTNTADSRIANKSGFLTAIATLTGARPTDEMSIVTPVICVDNNAAVLSANYVYISDFSRYYYITNIEVKSGSQVYIHCNADDRYNWYNYYKNKSCIITRSEKIGAPTAIPDSKLPIDPNRHQLLTLKILKDGSQVFANQLSDCDFVLAAVGNIKEQITPEPAEE